MIPKKKYYTPDEILFKLNGIIYNNKLEYYVAIALSKIPIKIADNVISKCFFACLEPSARGQYFTSIKGKRCLILIEYKFMRRAKPVNIELTILHEIAHHFLNHGDEWLENGKEKWQKDERDADNQVQKWLLEYNNASPISKLDSNQWTKQYLESKGITL